MIKLSVHRLKVLLLMFCLFLFGWFIVQKGEVKGVSESKKIYRFDARSLVLNKFSECEAKKICETNNPGSVNKDWDSLIEDLDKLNFLFSLQGIVNRDEPKLWLILNNASAYDDFWWNNFRDGSKSYGFLSDYEVVNLNTFDDVVGTFKNYPNLNGSVSYDTQYNGAGLSVAKTVAGADNLVIIRKGSEIFDKIKSSFEIKVNVPVYEHKKDVYRWAIDNYLKTGKSNPNFLDYSLDAWPIKLYERHIFTDSGSDSLVPFDQVILNKGFSFDLSVWAGEKPVDDVGQNCGDDRAVFEEILSESRKLIDNNAKIKNKMIFVWGYVPWQWKYFSGENSQGELCGSNKPSDFCYYGESYGTCDEEEYVKLLSSYGAYNGGGSYSLFGTYPSNMSVMYWGPDVDESKLINKKAPSEQELKDKGFLTSGGDVVNKTYVLPFFGDYEHSGGTAMLPVFYPRPWTWQRSNNTPAVWNFSVRVRELMPVVLNYLAETRGSNDYFGAGFGGAGYVYANFMNDTYLKEWKKHSGLYYSTNQWNVTMSLAANGNHDLKKPSDKVFDAYSSFSQQGINTYMDKNNYFIKNNVASSALQSPGKASGVDGQGLADKISEDYGKLDSSKPKFLTFRNIMYGPDIFDEAIAIEKNRHGDRNYVVVDPNTFYYLLRLQLGGNNDNKASFYIKEGLPKFFEKNKTYTLTLVARNDGWNNWYGIGGEGCNADKSGCFRLGYSLVSDLPEPVSKGNMPLVNYEKRADINKTVVKPGEEVEFQIEFTTPNTEGNYFLRADIVKEMGYWFEWAGNLPLTRSIRVKDEVVSNSCVETNGEINDLIDWYGFYRNKTYGESGDLNCDKEINVKDIIDWYGKYRNK